MSLPRDRNSRANMHFFYAFVAITSSHLPHPLIPLLQPGLGEGDQIVAITLSRPRLERVTCQHYSKPIAHKKAGTQTRGRSASL